VSKKICGHERTTLRFVLALHTGSELPDGKFDADSESVQLAHVAVITPEKLASIMAEVLRGFWAPPAYTVSVSWSDALNMRIVINVDHNGRFGTIDGSHGWTMVSARAITLKLLSCTSKDEALAALEAT
jgi:hypothetical protein